MANTPNTPKTRSQLMAEDVAALLRARNPLLWIKTGEEGRVERHLFEAAASAGYVPRTWDVAQGVADMSGKVDTAIGGNDPDTMLDAIRDRAMNTEKKERGLWILRDLPTWLGGPGGATTMRRLRNLARLLPGIARDSAQALIILSPSGDVPPELAGHATVIEWPLPDRAEIAATVDSLANTYKLELNGQREAAIDAAVGLSGEEAAACYSKSIVQTRTIDPTMVANEKKRVIAREKVLEWYDPLPDGLAAVGGLDNLKVWLDGRKIAFSPKAKAYGLPSPNGVLFVGVSGCGKSLLAKATATAWQVPLLRVDLGALKSKFVGESEANLRKAFRVIEAIGRCVVWFDEIEKALGGAISGGADGGVSSDALGAILTWMQERKGEAFVIATANDITGLPPEFLRKGRFDEIFFVDLPNATEREAVLTATLRKFGRAKLPIDTAAVAATCENYTGAEIAAIVPDAMFAAFADGEREIATADLIAAAKTVVPLIKTAEAKIEALRKWAKGAARPATLVTTTKAARADARLLDLEPAN